jgi:hypothetical protein
MIPVEIARATANREPEVEAGFRGDVHPALHGDQSLAVRAICSAIGKGRGFEEGYFPQQFRGPFDTFSVTQAVQDYSTDDFSAFLPQEFGQPGQIWKIEVDRVASFLRQFHPGASMNLAVPGRLSGPNGGFAVLRAISETHLEILARVHVEFVLAEGMYLTPA